MAAAINYRLNYFCLLQTIDNLGDVADSDGSDDEGLTVPDIASLSLNLYR